MACSEEERHHMAQPRSDDQILEAAPQARTRGSGCIIWRAKGGDRRAVRRFVEALVFTLEGIYDRKSEQENKRMGERARG